MIKQAKRQCKYLPRFCSCTVRDKFDISNPAKNQIVERQEGRKQKAAALQLPFTASSDISRDCWKSVKLMDITVM